MPLDWPFLNLFQAVLVTVIILLTRLSKLFPFRIGPGLHLPLLYPVMPNRVLIFAGQHYSISVLDESPLQAVISYNEGVN